MFNTDIYIKDVTPVALILAIFKSFQYSSHVRRKLSRSFVYSRAKENLVGSETRLMISVTNFISTMKRNYRKSILAVALNLFIADVQGAVISVQFEDRFTEGVASVGVGSPPTQYNLIIDLASSNTWVGADKAYVKTSTSQQTSDSVSEGSLRVAYGSGSFSGTELTDQVTLAPDLVVSSQSIGVASTSTGFDSVDGILGLGPVDLTQGTLFPDSHSVIPTVTDNLFAQGTISSNEVSIAGQIITFGGLDSNAFTGDITYAPITSTSPASSYWGIDASFTYGADGTSILPVTAGTIDHGTSLLMLATNAYSTFLKLTGATRDEATSLPALNSCAELQSIFLTISGTTFEITVEQYRWPADQYAVIGGDASKCYLGVGDIGSDSGSGLDFTVGYNTLKHFAVVFDTANTRVGIANVF